MGRPRLLLLGGVAAAACSRSPSPGPERFSVPGVTSVITTESGLLTAPVDLAIGPEGTLAILDYEGRIVVRPPRDSTFRSLGRPGPGPGEFLRPGAIARFGDHFYVADIGNGRLQTLNLDGRMGRMATLPATAAMGTVTVQPGGGFLVPTLGLYHTLAQRFDSGGALTGSFGTPPDSVPPTFNPRAAKEQLVAGSIPPLFRNNVLALTEPGGAVWLILNGEGRLERFRPDGIRVLSVPLAAPEMSKVRQEVIDRARATLDDARSTYALRYVQDAAFQDGVLWLLLNTTDGGPAVLLAVDAGGQARRRLEFPDVVGARTFAIDAGRRVVYFALPGSAAVVSSALPGAALVL